MSALDPIDHLLAVDLGGRGIATIFAPGAAASAAVALRRARRVLVTTGFSVPPGIPETDGPPGAAVVGRALRRLGAAVSYLTDANVAPVLAAALRALGEPPDVDVYTGDESAAVAALDRRAPSHLIAVERPGRNASGDYLSARGESVAAWNAPIDALFIRAARGWGAARRHRGAAGARRPGLRPVTVGVGDGGNEIGMGSVRARLVRERGLMARIASVVRVDHLVVAGTSNWGAYGIVAALGRRAGTALLHSGDEERRLLEACVRAGAVDGVTRRREATVDGLPLGAHVGVVELLRAAERMPVPRGHRV